MKIALIRDFRGDPAALHLLIQHARGRRVDAIWNCAALTANAAPNAVLDQLRAHQVASLLTDADLQVIKARQRSNKLRKCKDPDHWLLARWVYDTLSAENRRYLRLLTRSVRGRVGARRFALVSGSEPLPDFPDESQLINLAITVDTDIMIGRFGPEPFNKKFNSLQIINLGLPVPDPEWLEYLILTVSGNGCRIKPVRLKLPASAHSKATPAALQLPPVFLPLMESAPRSNEVGNAVPAPEPPEESWRAVLEFAAGCLIERPELIAHALQVTRLALELYDQLQPWHQCGAAERLQLQYAAMLHDIGWVTGPQAHHKSTLHIILNTALLPFAAEERTVIGLIARYHRRAHPNPRHECFNTLSAAARQTVTLLAALLRVADGLDSSHRQAVQSLRCQDDGATLQIDCLAELPAAGEPQQALEKGDLLAKIGPRKLVIEWKSSASEPRNS